MKDIKVTDLALFAKSFYLLGDSLDYCFDCKYCRLNGEKHENMNYHILPSEINPDFINLPVAVNLFYGDPLLQIDNTIKLLHDLENAKHKGPVIIVTKGDYSKFPDIKFDLDLHIAFSCFGVNSYLDGNTMERFENNLKEIKRRKNNYKYSIEFRPIIYNVNDTVESFTNVFRLAKEYNLPIGYSGLQGKPSSVKIWDENGLDLKPYPGYTFGHKKIIDPKIIELFEKLAKKYGVLIFRKTSCLISYVHNMNRDYNAHYYRPCEMNCSECIMREKCISFKNSLKEYKDLHNIIPFDYKFVDTYDHECILSKNKICEFPSIDCKHINGRLIKIKDFITTSDVRLIKWLTGYTVDANFIESPKMSESWVKNLALINKNKS